MMNTPNPDLLPTGDEFLEPNMESDAALVPSVVGLEEIGHAAIVAMVKYFEENPGIRLGPSCLPASMILAVSESIHALQLRAVPVPLVPVVPSMEEEKDIPRFERNTWGEIQYVTFADDLETVVRSELELDCAIRLYVELQALLTERMGTGDTCVWFEAGTLLRASCDKEHRGHGNRPKVCPYCGKPTVFTDRRATPHPDNALREAVERALSVANSYVSNEAASEIRKILKAALEPKG